MTDFVTRRHGLEWWGRPAQVSARFQFEPRYWLVGVSWDFRRHDVEGSDRWHGWFRSPWSLHVYVSLLPMVPLHIYVSRTVRRV